MPPGPPHASASGSGPSDQVAFMHRAPSWHPLIGQALRHVGFTFIRTICVLSACCATGVAACDRETRTNRTAIATPAAVDTPLTVSDNGDEAATPDEIYFDLTAFAWYREGRPLMHGGRAYLPQSDPVPVSGKLREAGSYEGVTYYVGEDAAEPFYTLYVPVYYRYWQRFTAPPGT